MSINARIRLPPRVSRLSFATMSTYDEIVPDSEPEREQLRRTRKARKSTEKKRTETLSSRDLNIVPQPPDLIEISGNVFHI